MKRFMFPLLLVLAFSFLHCKSDDAPSTGRLHAARKDAVGAVAKQSAKAETVTMTTSDNVVITGSLYRAGGTGTPAVLCLHQWRSDRGKFSTVAEAFQKAGITVLAIDMRGHGDSRKRSDGTRVEPDRAAGPDVAAAVAALQRIETVDGSRIGIMGASYGSSNALRHAAENPSIKALALLSPGLNFFNVLPTEPAVKSLRGRPMIAIASADDFRSVEAIKRYQEITPGSLTVEYLTNAGHGTDMIYSTPGLATILKDFFQKNL